MGQMPKKYFCITFAIYLSKKKTPLVSVKTFWPFLRVFLKFSCSHHQILLRYLGSARNSCGRNQRCSVKMGHLVLEQIGSRVSTGWNSSSSRLQRFLQRTTCPSLEVGSINLPLKDEQKTCALKDTQKSTSGASCLQGSSSYIQNSWPDAISTHMDTFPTSATTT